MDQKLHDLILRLLNEHRIMSVATNRPDGWPQNTVVGYANTGLILYAFVGRTGQKFLNIARDPRVSIAISSDFSDPNAIQGLSMAARAAPVQDKTEFARAGEAFLKRYPEYASMPVPDPALAPMMRFTPEVISVLDYAKGFGHSDLVKVSRGDLGEHVESARKSWFGK
jgi:general stress protein 26